MELRQLEYFKHVAELGSFTRAASFLSVVQPALSRQVRQLEVELGQTLFERNGRGVILTDAGSRLLEHTRGILTQIGRARQELEEQRNGDSGHFTLGLPPSLGSSITVPLVKAFAESMPQVCLATVEGLSTYILEWLNIGRVDCALVYSAAASPSIDLQPLLEEQLFLVSPLKEKTERRARRAIDLAELSQYPLIIPSRPHAMRMSVENALANAEQKIRVVHEIESIPAIIDLVRQRHGFAVLPLNAVKSSPFAGDVQLMPILSPVLKAPLLMAMSAHRPKSSMLRRASDIVREVIRREIKTSEVST